MPASNVRVGDKLIYVRLTGPSGLIHTQVVTVIGVSGSDVWVRYDHEKTDLFRTWGDGGNGYYLDMLHFATKSRAHQRRLSLIRAIETMNINDVARCTLDYNHPEVAEQNLLFNPIEGKANVPV